MNIINMSKEFLYTRSGVEEEEEEEEKKFMDCLQSIFGQDAHAQLVFPGQFAPDDGIDLTDLITKGSVTVRFGIGCESTREMTPEEILQTYSLVVGYFSQRLDKDLRYADHVQVEPLGFDEFIPTLREHGWFSQAMSKAAEQEADEESLETPEDGEFWVIPLNDYGLLDDSMEWVSQEDKWIKDYPLTSFDLTDPLLQAVEIAKEAEDWLNEADQIADVAYLAEQDRKGLEAAAAMAWEGHAAKLGIISSFPATVL